jgi:transcriptional regulator with XRE-family HTH domain
MLTNSTPRSPNHVDIFVGEKLTKLRREHDYSQKDVADLLGVSFQQIQKYERGKNRISVGRLWELSVLFSVTPNYFYKELINDTAAQKTRPMRHTAQIRQFS